MDESNEQNNLPTELEECIKLRDEYLAGWQRCKADFLNYKKEEAERMEVVVDYAKRKLLLDILLIFDAFDKAQENLPEDLTDNQWGDGFLQIKKQFDDVLKQEGILEIKALGEQFNPEWHEAIEQVEAVNEESGRVVEVLQKGYTIDGKLLRAAKVKVNK